MNLLSRFLRNPAIIAAWEAEDWNRFLPLARNARLLGRCLYLFEQHGLMDTAPPRLVEQLRGALTQTRYVQQQARRELRQVQRALEREGIPLMALKGLAYLAAGLPPSDWRNLSDIDLLLHECDIERAEAVLMQAGWVPSGEFDDYDQHYYREWMHEVPPLRHHNRETEVDLHHNLAPPVSRIRIDADRLWQDAVTLAEEYGRRVAVLSPVDLLLHNAVHLFMNDELRGGLRDVVDFRDLFRHFSSTETDFGQRLLQRAEDLGCGRPLFYAAMTAQRLAGLDLSPDFRSAVKAHAPAYPVARLMDVLIEQVLAPQRPGMWQTAFASQLLFIRSHWVRMPPLMLLRHLWHKAVKSKQAATKDAEMPG